VSDDRLKRRRFLADMLFAGGALGAAALTARWMSQAPPPAPQQAAVRPSPFPPPAFDPNLSTQPPALDGDVMPVTPGRVAAPQVQIQKRQ
jgi:hypothetical protein